MASACTWESATIWITPSKCYSLKTLKGSIILGWPPSSRSRKTALSDVFICIHTSWVEEITLPWTEEKPGKRRRINSYLHIISLKQSPAMSLFRQTDTSQKTVRLWSNKKGVLAVFIIQEAVLWKESPGNIILYGAVSANSIQSFFFSFSSFCFFSISFLYFLGDWLGLTSWVVES